MKLSTQEIIQRPKANGQKQALVKGTDDEFDFKPVVRLFTPDPSAIAGNWKGHQTSLSCYFADQISESTLVSTTIIQYSGTNI